MLRKYCDNNDIDIIEVYNDAGYSGKDLMRPGMQKLLNDIKSHKIDTLVAIKVDRLTRNNYDGFWLLNYCEEHNVKIILTLEPFDVSTANGEMIFGMNNESLVLDQFKNRLKTLGYKIEQRYNKISVYIEGKEKVRLEKIFGPEYSTENIINRFNTSHYKPLKKLNNKSIYNLFLEDTKSPFKGIRQLYLYYCYLLGVFPKKYSNQHLSHEMRLEAKKLDKISKEAKFLSNNNIETIEDLDLIENKYLNELYILKDTREKLQRKYHRTKDEETKKEISSKLESLKHKIKELYNIKNYISDIRTRIPKIEEQIKDLDNNMPKSYTRENVK